MAIYKDQDELLNTDWQKKIDEAHKAGDYRAAAQYEQARNDKINSSAYTGKINQTTNNYGGWIDGKDYAAVAQQQMASGASAADVLETYNNRLNKVTGTVGMEDRANDEHMQAMLEYVAANMGATEKPTFDYSAFDESKPTYESSYSARIDQLLNEILNRDGFSYDVAAPTYNDTYTDKIKDQAALIENYAPFSYDMANDPMYQQYAAQYQREGNRAMNDTLASVASGAGGMNSYAVTAAQQANNYYNAQLNDRIPELAQLAYEMYLQDFDREMDELSMLRNLGETEYNRYRDQYGDYLNERNTAYQQYLNDIDNQVRNLGLLQDMDATQYSRYRDTMNDWRNDRDFAYGAYRDDVGDYQYDQEWERQLEQDKLAQENWQKEFDTSNDHWQKSFDTSNSQWQQEFDTSNSHWQQEFDTGNSQYNNETAYNRVLDMISLGVMPDEAMLAAAGITKEKAAAMIAGMKSGSTGSGGGGGGGSSSGGSGGSRGSGGSKDDDDTEETGSSGYAGNDGIDEETIMKMQNLVGATPDGKWGNNSSAAAGGMSASEAYKAYKAGTLAPPSDNYEVTNRQGDGWVHVQGFGRITWVELENMVDRGDIEEITDRKNGTITYRKAK